MLKVEEVDEALLLEVLQEMVAYEVVGTGCEGHRAPGVNRPWW